MPRCKGGRRITTTWKGTAQERVGCPTIDRTDSGIYRDPIMFEKTKRTCVVFAKTEARGWCCGCITITLGVIGLLTLWPGGRVYIIVWQICRSNQQLLLVRSLHSPHPWRWWSRVQQLWARRC